MVFCPESKNAEATQRPLRRELGGGAAGKAVPTAAQTETDTSLFRPPASPAPLPVTESPASPIPAAEPAELPERHFTIFYNDTGHSYESILLPYAKEAKEVIIDEPYLRLTHQQQNFVRFCEALVKVSAVRKIVLTTSFDETTNLQELEERLGELKAEPARNGCGTPDDPQPEPARP